MNYCCASGRRRWRWWRGRHWRFPGQHFQGYALHSQERISGQGTAYQVRELAFSWLYLCSQRSCCKNLPSLYTKTWWMDTNWHGVPFNISTKTGFTLMAYLTFFRKKCELFLLLSFAHKSHNLSFNWNERCLNYLTVTWPRESVLLCEYLWQHVICLGLLIHWIAWPKDWIILRMLLTPTALPRPNREEKAQGTKHF